MTDDLAANGLVGFSLRRAARAAGTTHKVLLYYFDGPDDLLAQAVRQLRDRRIGNALTALALPGAGTSLAARVSVIWPILLGEEGRVLDQAIGLTLYDPLRYAELGRGASQQYLPTLLAICPEHWHARRKQEVAALILATLRGFLIERMTGGKEDDVEAGLAALIRALDSEEASPD